MFFKVQFGLHWNFTYNKLKDQKALTLASLKYICSHTKNIDKDLIGPAVFIVKSVVSGCGCISHNQMLSLQLLSFHYKPNTLISHLLVHSDAAFKKRRSHLSSFPSCIVHAVEKDSQHFEVDTDKAREALQELDQQLQSLSQKQVKSPKMRAPDVDRSEFQMTEKMPEISESFLAYLTVFLLFFTIFYNVLFYTVIKPAIDGPEPVSTTTVVEASKDQIN